MNSKSLLIAIAALALTATGAQAFSGAALVRAGLTEEQKSAFEEARELRDEGNITGARDVLVSAGIDETVIEKVREALRNERNTKYKAIEAAIESNDFPAFTAVIKDSPLAELINTPADFASFREAHALKESGDKVAARAILDDLGVPQQKGNKGMHRVKEKIGQSSFVEHLSNTQKAAFMVARQANDRDAMDAILDEAGVVKPSKGETPKFLRDGRELDN